MQKKTDNDLRKELARRAKNINKKIVRMEKMENNELLTGFNNLKRRIFSVNKRMRFSERTKTLDIKKVKQELKLINEYDTKDNFLNKRAYNKIVNARNERVKEWHKKRYPNERELSDKEVDDFLRVRNDLKDNAYYSSDELVDMTRLYEDKKQEAMMSEHFEGLDDLSIAESFALYKEKFIQADDEKAFEYFEKAMAHDHTSLIKNILGMT